MARLGDICQKGSSGIAQKDLEGNNGIYPIYGASGFIKNVDFFQQDRPYVAVVKDGAGVGRVIKLPAKSSVIGTMQYIIPNDDVNVNYLAYALENMNLAKYYTGATIPHIYFKDYCQEMLPSHNWNEQCHIAEILDEVSNLIALRKQQLDKLDKLVKARFVEMFGDPKYNNRGFSTAPMTELCEIIDGDRGKNYPKQDEFSKDGYCLFLNAKNVTSSGFNFENCLFITQEKDLALHNGKLQRGDVVLTTRGTLGNLAFYTDEVPYEHIRINSGMVILRMNRNLISEIFFIEQFKIQLETIKQKIASGSAQPQLPISTMNQIMMILPEVSLQNHFEKFVSRVENEKLTIRQGLDKLEMMKKALMQHYFGG